MDEVKLEVEDAEILQLSSKNIYSCELQSDCAEWGKAAVKDEGNSKTNIPFGWIVSSTPIRLTLIIPPS